MHFLPNSIHHSSSRGQERAARVCHGFGTRAHSYDAVTPVQEQMGGELLRLLDRLVVRSESRMCVDLGCGTGRLTARFQEAYPLAQVQGLDLSAKMVQEARSRHPSIDFRVEDALCWGEANEGRFAVIFTNAMLQWIEEPVLALRKWARSLAKNGALVFSTFVEGTFRELQSSFLAAYEAHGLKVKSHLLPFVTSESLRAQLPLLHAGRATVVTRHASPAGFLRSLREAGAASTGGTVCPVPRRILRSMTEHYVEHFSDVHGQIEASYEVFYGVLGAAGAAGQAEI